MKNIIAVTLGIFAYISSSSSEPSPTIVPIEGGISGVGITTRYWDCCKPSCSWPENAKSNITVRSCAIDGSTSIDPETPSGCMDDGTSYMCTDQSPFVINSTLAYGFVAASFTGGVDYSLCCGCVLLTFQSGIVGKQMVVQVTNAGGDLNYNQFDIAMPGGGVGLFNGCTKQWGAPEDGWGERYGGVTSESECDELPEVLRAGCKFRFQFMEGAPNPNVTFVQVECPKELVDVTGCGH